MRILIPVALLLVIAGCGLAGTAVTGAAGAASEAKQAETAKAQMDRARQDVEAAQKTADEQRDKALKEAGQ